MRIYNFIILCFIVMIGIFPCRLLALSSPYSIQGLTDPALTNAQNAVNTLFHDSPSEFNSLSINIIKQAIQPFGYFKSQVTRQGNTFFVKKGPPLRITSLHVSLTGEGKNNANLQHLIDKFPLQQNQILMTEDYKKAKSLLFHTALNEGYLNSRFTTQLIQINRRHYTCNIILILNTGPRYYFGSVLFNRIYLNEQFLRRYIPFKKGEPFSSKKLLQLQNDLTASPYFKKVVVENQSEKTLKQHVPIKITLAMKDKRQYVAGMGFGTDTGPRTTLGANFNYVNSDGHYVNSQAVLSLVQSNVGINYVIPGENPATDHYTISELLFTNHLNQGSSQTQRFGISYVKMLANNWQRTYSLNYNIEQFKFDDIAGQSSFLLIPGINFTHITTAQSRIFTNQGNKFWINLQGALRQGLSNNNFFQVEIQDKAITHITDNDRIIVRGDVGYTYTDDLNTLPLSLRFYAGGAQSVRGFTYQGIGPGKYLAVGSVEYQHRIKGNWYGGVFYDAGNAANTTDTPFAQSTGIGIMWASPMGPIELTLAKAISLPGKPLRIQFVMGPDL